MPSQYPSTPLPLRALSLVTSAFLLATCIGAVALCLGAWTGQVQLLHVLTGSMAPTYPVGTPLLVAPTPPTDLQVGEVVSFQPPAPYAMPGGAPVLHRIVAVQPTANGRHIVVTKGDANARPDAWRLDSRTTQFRRVLVAAPYLSGVTRHLIWVAGAALLLGMGLDAGLWWSRRRCTAPDRRPATAPPAAPGLARRRSPVRAASRAA